MPASTFPAATLFALGLLLGACAHTGQSPTDRGVSSGQPEVRAVKNQVRFRSGHLDLVATDMVTTMVQLQEMSPYSSTLQVSPPPTAFGKALVRALAYAGYGLQQVSSDQGVRYLSYGTRITENENGQFTDFFLAIGNITINRAYNFHDGVILPASRMRVNGSRSQANVALNDRIFLQQGSDLTFQNAVELVSPDNARMVNMKRRVSAGPTPERGTGFNQYEALIWAREVLAGSRFDQHILRKLERYTPIYQTQLQFANNSEYLGLDNKDAVNMLFDRFDPDTDIYTLDACDKGGSATPESRQHRARVKEEFLFLGAPIDSIIFKSCPAGPRTDTEQFAALELDSGQSASPAVSSEFTPGQVIITQYRTRNRSQLTEDAVEPVEFRQ